MGAPDWKGIATMIIVLDTETTGLPVDYHAPLTDFDNWPRAVQIAWANFDNDGNFIEKHNHIIFPDGYEIPEDATAKHGITTARAQIEGVPINNILEALAGDMVRADWIVAHNMDFDASILGSEFLRADYENYFDTTDMICTMQASTDFCAIPGPRGNTRGNKWPRLSELYAILFEGASIEGEHNAEVDVLACAKCFFELVKRGVVTLQKEESIEVIDTQLDKQASEIVDFLIKKEEEKSAQSADEAARLFDPLELARRLIRAYDHQDQTRMTLHHAEHTTWLAQRELDEVNFQLRKTEGYLDCKNDPQRADYLYTNNQQHAHAVGIAKTDELGARLDFERAQDEVERARALLRVAELDAAIVRRKI
jgi:DNA polymerase III epsilon subunit-like protein